MIRRSAPRVGPSLTVIRWDVDGTSTTHDPRDAAWTLDELQALVGGLIEPVYLPLGMVALVDEEGLLRDLPRNLLASIAVGRPLVGPVVIGPRRILQ